MGEDDGFVCLFLGAELVEVVDKHFNLGGGGPVLHFDAVDDRVLLYVVFILLDVGLVEVDGERDVAAWAIGCCGLERSDVVFGTFTTEFVVAARADRLFGCLVAYVTNQDVLSAFGVFLEY